MKKKTVWIRLISLDVSYKWRKIWIKRIGVVVIERKKCGVGRWRRRKERKKERKREKKILQIHTWWWWNTLNIYRFLQWIFLNTTLRDNYYYSEQYLSLLLLLPLSLLVLLKMFVFVYITNSWFSWSIIRENWMTTVV